jgi:hypothetical protein
MEILKILNEEKGLLLDMVDALKIERRALINDDIKNLESAVKSKEELKNKIDAIEEIRIKRCGSKKLKEILSLFEGDERKEAEDIGKEMEDAVFKIREINNTNRLLINQSLNYIRAVMNTLTPPNVKSYNSSGSVSGSGSSNGIFDTSV